MARTILAHLALLFLLVVVGLAARVAGEGEAAAPGGGSNDVGQMSGGPYWDWDHETSQLCFNKLKPSAGSTVTATVNIVIGRWVERSTSDIHTFVSVGHDASESEVEFLKASISPNIWNPKLQATKSGDKVIFAVPPVEDARNRKRPDEFKISLKFRLAKGLSSGRRITFTLLGAGLVPQITTLTVK